VERRGVGDEGEGQAHAEQDGPAAPADAGGEDQPEAEQEQQTRQHGLGRQGEEVGLAEKPDTAEADSAHSEQVAVDGSGAGPARRLLAWSSAVTQLTVPTAAQSGHHQDGSGSTFKVNA